MLAAPALLDVTGAPRPIEGIRWRARARPNPFASVTEFSVEPPDGAAGRAAGVSLFDTGGRKVRSLRLPPEGPAPSGTSGASRLIWDGADDSGRTLPNGVYFFRIDWCGAQAVGRVAMVR